MSTTNKTNTELEIANHVLNDLYDIQGAHLKKMDGYGSLNYQVKIEDMNFVLKVYTSDEDVHLLHAENQLFKYLATQTRDMNTYPEVLPTTDGKFISTYSYSNQTYYVRLLSFMEGDLLAEVKHTDPLLESFGTFLGKMDKTLLHFQHPAINARVVKWDNQHLLLNKNYIDLITDIDRRRLVQYFFMQFREEVQPLHYQLRKSTIHNDANDWNILTHEGEVSAIIDFGDMCYSYLINELAVAIPYALFEKKDPIHYACLIIKNYHQELPLEERELDVLYYLIATRLCVSVCNSAFSKKQMPDNQYITISEKPAWELLEKWITINPNYAANQFRAACGFENKTSNRVDFLLEKRKEVLSEGLSISYSTPINFEKGALQYMYDYEGNTYLDAYNNIKHVGHCHPKIVHAIQRQAAKLNTNTRYLYSVLTEYADSLLENFPKKLNKVFFVNSGSAATDLAIRIARVCTGNKEMLVMEQGYHGNTIAGIEVSHYKFHKKNGGGEPEHIHTLPFPTNDLHISNLNASNWKAAILMTLAEATKNGLAGFIAEPILGCAGQMPLPKGYLKMVFEEVRANGGLCIVDEVQIGFGRTGTFGGWEQHDVIPDLIILGKPMGNGHPIGAVVTTTEIAQQFDNGVEFFSSFGGNPVSCLVGKSVLEVIEDEELIGNAIKVGNYFKSKLLALQKNYSIIHEVRGFGLFLGVEFRRPHEVESITPWIKEELKKRFILTSTDGPGERTLKIKPPMIFSKKNVDEFIEALEDILKMEELNNQFE